jgi:hypothetical protein
MTGSLMTTFGRIAFAHDATRAPTAHAQLSIDGGEPRAVERFDYGERLTDAAARNLRGLVYRHFDPSGLVTNERFDFKGNSLEVTRRLARDFSAPVIHWPATPPPEAPPAEAFEGLTFTCITEVDALNRMTRCTTGTTRPPVSRSMSRTTTSAAPC